jgi:hypothetical protein
VSKIHSTRKEKYLLRCGINSNRSKILRSLFNAIAPFEDKLGLDYCELTAEQRDEMLRQAYAARSPRNYRLAQHYLGVYCNWCADEGWPVAERYVKAVTVKYKKPKPTPKPRVGLSKRFVSSPAHLSSILDKLYDPLELDTSHIIYRAGLWLIYGGVPPTNISSIRVSDVDFNTMTIQPNGEIYREGVETLMKACTLPALTQYHPYYTTVRERKNTEFVLAGVRSDVLAPDALTTHSLVKKLPPELRAISALIAPKRLFISGVYYRLLLSEQRGEKPDFHGAYLTSLLASNPNADNPQGYWNNASAKVFAQGYGEWKATFYTVEERQPLIVDRLPPPT